MEVVEENVAHLSNYEVLALLNERQANKKNKNHQPQATVFFSTIKYLNGTSCSTQTPEKIRNFMKAVQPFKLTKCEKLALLNLSPSTPLEMQLIVEASDDGRLSEAEIDSLLELVQIHLGDGSAKNTS
ncbi:CGRP receptor component [Cotesia typhae]